MRLGNPAGGLSGGLFRILQALQFKMTITMRIAGDHRAVVPTLTLAQIYGANAYYRENEQTI